MDYASKVILVYKTKLQSIGSGMAYVSQVILVNKTLLQPRNKALFSMQDDPRNGCPNKILLPPQLMDPDKVLSSGCTRPCARHAQELIRGAWWTLKGGLNKILFAARTRSCSRPRTGAE